MKRQINIKGAECKVSSLSVRVVQLDRFESAGSRAVIGRKLSYPRTGRPEGFTASFPHMGPGMGGDDICGKEGGRVVVFLGEKRQARGLHGCAREECLGDLGPVVSGKGSDLTFDE